MTTPDTLASLPKKWRDNHRDDNDGPCSLDCADELEASLDALAEKWEATAKGIPDGYYLEAAFAKALKACAAELRK